MTIPALEFVEIIPPSPIALGWRHDNLLSEDMRQTLADYLEPEDESWRCFTPARQVAVAPFQIAKRTFDWETAWEWDDEVIDEIDSLAALCDLLDARLKPHGLRLPTEDEFEIACGGSLFPWGEEIPPGMPVSSWTDFTRHQEPNQYGLLLNSDTYQTEVTRTALKLGDGGVAVCGGLEWPLSWMSLCPAFFVCPGNLEGCLFEHLESAQIRPVMV